MASTGQAWAKGSLQPTGLPVIGTTRRPDCLSRAMASTTWSGTTPSVVRVSSMSVRMPSGDAGGVQRDSGWRVVGTVVKMQKPPGAACKRAAFARTDRARKGSILLPGEFDDGLVELVGAVLGVVWGQLHAVDAVFGCALEALVDHREVVGADEGGACVVVGDR